MTAPAVLVECADAVVAALAAHDFGVVFTPVRTWNNLAAELTDGSLRVEVVGVTHKSYDLQGRGNVIGYGPQCAIGIRQRFGSADQNDAGQVNQAAIDRLVKLLEDIADFVTERTVGDNVDYQWVATEFLTSVVHEWLEQFKQYTGILLVTYAHSKDL